MSIKISCAPVVGNFCHALSLDDYYMRSKFANENFQVSPETRIPLIFTEGNGGNEEKTDSKMSSKSWFADLD